MKLLYACADRADDPHHWSGMVSNCRAALGAAGIALEVFDRIPFEVPSALRLLHQWHKRFGRRTHSLQIERAVLQRAAERIAARFAAGDCDAIFCPGTGVPVFAYLPAGLPVFAYLDATKRAWIETYFGLGTLCARSRRQVDLVDRTALANNTLTIFSSEWARAGAARDYGVPADRLAVVPFGANLESAPTRAEVELWVLDRRRWPLRLLFLGKEWQRKGGPEALELIRALRRLGLPATLDIVGCVPALAAPDRALTRVHGFVDHSTPAGGKIFRALLQEAHVLLFLSRAEAYGIALCEAAAYGVPALATAVGGIPTIVQDGRTGWLADLPFFPESVAARLAADWRAPGVYRRMALAARDDYEARLNWPVAAKHLETLITGALARRSAATPA